MAKEQVADGQPGLFDYIRSLTFIKFAILFGTMWIAGRGGEETGGKYDRWNFWPGVRGFMGQLDMLRTFAEAIISWLSKARQMGGSEGAALYAIFVCMTEPKSLVMVFSKDGPAAKAFLKDRVRRKLEGMLGLDRGDGQPWPWYDENGKLPWEIFDARVEFWNGSVIEAHSSDDSGAVSRTFRIVIFDEVRFYARENAKEMWTSILGALNPPAQVLVISTAEHGSWYNEKTKDVRDGLIPSAAFIFIPDDTNPAHNPEWRRIRELELGDAVALSRDNPLQPDDIYASHEGAVLALKKQHWQDRELKWHIGEEFYLIYDHGNTRSHPAVCWFVNFNIYDDFAYVFDEVFVRDAEKFGGLDYVGERIKEKLDHYRAMFGEGDMPNPFPIADTAMFGKTGVRPMSEVLNEATELSWNKALKHDKQGSTALLISRVLKNKIAWHSRCKFSRQQLEGWVWDGDTDLPVETEDDACFSSATEVLTPTGWVSLEKMELGDTVAVVSQDGVLTFEANTGVVHKNYTGGVHSINHEHIEFTATDDHRHAVMSQFDWKIKEKYWLEKSTLDELVGQSYWANTPHIYASGEGVFFDGEKEPASFSGRGKTPRNERIAWLAGIWLAEGCFDTHRPTFIIIDQKKRQHKRTIKYQLKKLGWTFSETKSKTNKGMSRFVITRQPWFKDFLLEKFGQHSYGKTLLPKTIMSMTKAERAAFYEGYMCGDGCRTQSSHHFDSVSKNMVDGLQVLCASIGYGCRIVSYDCMAAREQMINGQLCNVRQSYRGHVHRQQPCAHIDKPIFVRSQVVDIPVHCIRTRTGMFWARTNGKMFVAGNCDVGRYFCSQISWGGKRKPPKTPLERAFERMDRGKSGEDDEPSPIDFERLGYGALEPKYGMGETVSEETV